MHGNQYFIWLKVEPDSIYQQEEFKFELDWVMVRII